MKTGSEHAYRYDRYFLNGKTAQNTVDALSTGLFEVNARTPNAVVFEAEKARISKLLHRLGIPFNEELLGYDWAQLSEIMMKIRGVVYNHVPVITKDIITRPDFPNFVECAPMPEEHALPADLDVFLSSTTTIRYVKERPDWSTRYGLFNQRLQGQTFREEGGQDAVRTGFWMLPPEVVDIAFDADPVLAQQAFSRFGQMQFAVGHDGLFHMPIHGIHQEEPHYDRLREWSDLLYDVPAEIQYPHGGQIPNYEMLAVRSHRMAFNRAAEHNPAIVDWLIRSFVEYEAIVMQLADRIDGSTESDHFMKYMMTLYKTPLFHVVPPDTQDPRILELAQWHPYIMLNNRLMNAIHRSDTIHTTEGALHVGAVIGKFKSMLLPFAKEKGLA
jgi:hypothetical protein